MISLSDTNFAQRLQTITEEDEHNDALIKSDDKIATVMRENNIETQGVTFREIIPETNAICLIHYTNKSFLKISIQLLFNQYRIFDNYQLFRKTINMPKNMRETYPHRFRFLTFHELGHLLYKHLDWKSLSFRTRISLGTAYVAGCAAACKTGMLFCEYFFPTDKINIKSTMAQVLFFSVYSLAIDIFVSRTKEKQADDFAIANSSIEELEGGIACFKDMQKHYCQTFFRKLTSPFRFSDQKIQSITNYFMNSFMMVPLDHLVSLSHPTYSSRIKKIESALRLRQKTS